MAGAAGVLWGDRVKISWRDIRVFDADGYRLQYAERVTVLDTWRKTGCLPPGHEFNPFSLPREEAEGYGPRTPAEVDWDGFDDRPG